MLIKKNLLINLALFLFSILASLVILEISLRILKPNYDPRGSIYFISLKDGTPLAPPNFSGKQWHNRGEYKVAININKYGFRDKNDLSNSTDKDIFVVGDSFSFGWGVEEQRRYSGVLENLIKIPVYNISILGDFDNYEGLINYAEANGAKIRNLIIGVCMEGDILAYGHKDKESNRALYPRGILSWLIYIKNILTMKSTTYRLIARLVNQNESILKIAIRLKLVEDPYTIEKNYFDQDLILWSANKLISIAKKYNTIVLIIPSRMLYYNKNEEELKVHLAFVSLLKTKGLVVIDMYEYFKNSDPLRFHFKHDGHWNDKGHELAGKVLYRYIKMTNIFETKK